MARYPVTSSTRSPVGQGMDVEGHVNVDTGASRTWEAVGRLGAQILRTGTMLHRMQGEAELTGALAENDHLVNKMVQEMAENKDPETYEEIAEDVLSQMQSRELKNGWARDRYAHAMTTYEPHFRKIVQKAADDRVYSNWNMSLANAEAKAIETGQIGGFVALIGSAMKAGRITADGAQVEIRRVGRLAERRQFEAIAADDPGKILALDSWRKMNAASTYLTPQDYPYLRGLAKAQSTDMVNRQEAARQQYEMELWMLAADPNTTMLDIWKKISALPAELYTIEAKDKLFEREIDRAEKIRAGFGDPLVIRQDWTKYKELLFGVRDRSVTESDIREAVNDGQITIGDAQHLFNVLDGKAKDRDDTYEVTRILQTVDDIIDERFGGLFPEAVMRGASETAKLKFHMALEDRMSVAEDAGRPLQGRELMNEALRIEREIEAEAINVPTMEQFLPVPERTAPGQPFYEDGVQIGSYDQNGQIELNEVGERRLIELTAKRGWDIEQLTAYVKRNNYAVKDSE